MFKKWWINPKYWTMLYDYDETIDDFFKSILSSRKSKIDFLLNVNSPISTNTIRVIPRDYFAIYKGTEFWLANYPYAYLTVRIDEYKTLRPSRDTIYEFHKFINNWQKEFPELVI
jgi:hypothetical protein